MAIPTPLRDNQNLRERVSEGLSNLVVGTVETAIGVHTAFKLGVGSLYAAGYGGTGSVAEHLKEGLFLGNGVTTMGLGKGLLYAGGATLLGYFGARSIRRGWNDVRGNRTDPTRTEEVLCDGVSQVAVGGVESLVGVVAGSSAVLGGVHKLSESSTAHRTVGGNIHYSTHHLSKAAQIVYDHIPGLEHVPFIDRLSPDHVVTVAGTTSLGDIGLCAAVGAGLLYVGLQTLGNGIDAMQGNGPPIRRRGGAP
ncbi:hypothetical protein CMO92_04610 [Candidatus Woesearchaeota archaeon]|nr:hypothetical protein [Candidatus Woesearchaeota archaeon]|tara:strand:+ start:274 stop:1026 length:753 start_codon:yes stop_codon:yes gene_type:complete